MIQKVQQLGKQISESKSNKAKYEGAMEQIIASMKQSMSLNSVEEAQAQITKLALQIEAKEAEAGNIYTNLTTKYTW